MFIFLPYPGAEDSYCVPSAQTCRHHQVRSTDFEAFSYLLPSIEFGTLSWENKGGELQRFSCVKSPIKHSWLQQQESRHWRSTLKINRWHDSDALSKTNLTLLYRNTINKTEYSMSLKKKATSSASSSRHDLHCRSYTDKWICQIVKKSQPSYKNTDILWEVCVGC